MDLTVPFMLVFWSKMNLLDQAAHESVCERSFCWVFRMHKSSKMSENKDETIGIICLFLLYQFRDE